MVTGYFKLQRRFFGHWLWSEKRSLSKAEAWLDLLQIAAFVPTKRIVRDKLLQIAEGEAVASLRYLAERWDWNKDKVAAFLKLLESDDMIRREVRHGESVIILTRYREYAGLSDTTPDTGLDDNQTEARQRPDKEEEGKEGKELEKEKRVAVAMPPIFDFWNGHGRLPKIKTWTKSRKIALANRSKDPFYQENWETAVRMAAESEFLTGGNDRGWAAHIDWFLRPETVPKIIEGKYENTKPQTPSKNRFAGTHEEIDLPL